MSLLPIRPELADVAPYGAPQLPGLIQLNVNENPFAPPAIVVDDIARSVRQAAGGLNRYPDREFRALREALAGYLGREADAAFLGPEQLWAANGSNEVMLQLFQAFGGPGRHAVWAAPTYSMYPEYARDSNTAFVALPRVGDAPHFDIDLEALIRHIRDERPAIVVIANPNNPTGTWMELELIEQVAEATVGPEGANAIVIVDEAYAEFRAPGTPSAVPLIDRYLHVAVARTMSKAFALAGARLGYLAAHAELLDAIRRVRLPYHLSAITQASALAALRHADVLQEQVALLRRERDAMVEFLKDVAGGALLVADSHANFVLFGRFEDAAAVWQGLVDRGVLIREVGPAGFLRVSIGTPEQNGAFRRALVEVLESGAGRLARGEERR